MTGRHVRALLLSANVVAALALVAMWLQPGSGLRNTRWTAPAAVVADYRAMLPPLPEIVQTDTSQFLGMLERPLFSATRRPPPPPPPSPSAAPVEPPPDNLRSATLSGVYTSADGGGAILTIAGKTRRMQVQQSFEGWTLQSVQERGVTFVRGGETLTLQLPKANLRAAPAGNAPPATAPSPAGATGGAAGEAPKGPTPRAVFGGTRS